jgi:hypothetical protein
MSNNNTKKIHAGAPTKYDPKYCEEIIKHFDIEPFKDVDIPHMGKTGEFKWMDYKRMANGFPTFLGFAKKIGVNGDTLVEWASAKYPDDYEDKEKAGKLKHPKFSAAYTRAKEFQKWILIENGLNGLYNPQFTIFVAKNITDMKDKTEAEVNEKMEGLITFRPEKHE